MTHTPGPWTYETDHISGVYWIFSNFHGDESNALATVHGQDDIPEMENNECASNAALISAAPDLLAACEAALFEDSGLRCANDLRKTIEKAKGKQS